MWHWSVQACQHITFLSARIPQIWKNFKVSNGIILLNQWDITNCISHIISKESFPKYLFCRTKVPDSSASWHVSWVLVVPWVSLFVYWSSVGLPTEELIIFSSSTVRVFTSIQEKAPTNGILVYYFLIVNCMSFSLELLCYMCSSRRLSSAPAANLLWSGNFKFRMSKEIFVMILRTMQFSG